LRKELQTFARLFKVIFILRDMVFEPPRHQVRQGFKKDAKVLFPWQLSDQLGVLGTFDV